MAPPAAINDLDAHDILAIQRARSSTCRSTRSGARPAAAKKPGARGEDRVWDAASAT